MSKDDKAVQGAKTPYTAKTVGNAIGFLFDQKMKEVYTALPVQVVAVYPADTTGYVDVLPMVGTYDGKKEYIAPVNLYHLPYSRIQGGKAALIIDPVAGDKGLAVFCGQDVSNVTAGTTEPQQPGSYRSHSMSDGYYIGGFLNQKPETFLELKNDGTAILTAPGGLTINADIQLNGSMNATGDVVASGISLNSHVHGGVQSGGSSTSGPR